MDGQEGYSNGDLRRLHERIDTLDKKIDDKLSDLFDDQNDLAVAIGKIETTLKMLPAAPERPCEQLKSLNVVVAGHIKEHKEIRRLWQRPVVGMLIHLFEIALVAFLTWLITTSPSRSIRIRGVDTPAQAEISQKRGDRGQQ